MSLADAYNARPSREALALTRRESQVAALIAKALPYKQIAFDLGISVKTVSKHAANIHEKLGIQTGIQVAHWAIAHGLVAPITNWKTQ